MDVGFYAFDLPFYRLVLGSLFIATFLAPDREPVGPLPVRRHPAVGSDRGAEPGRPHPADQPHRNPGAAQGRRVLAGPLRAVVAHPQRNPFTGATYTDINAVLPAKLILLSIAMICAVAVFVAIVLRDLRLPAIAVVLLLLSSMIVGAAWPLSVSRSSSNRTRKGARVHQPQHRRRPGTRTA